MTAILEHSYQGIISSHIDYWLQQPHWIIGPSNHIKLLATASMLNFRMIWKSGKMLRTTYVTFLPSLLTIKPVVFEKYMEMLKANGHRFMTAATYTKWSQYLTWIYDFDWSYLQFSPRCAVFTLKFTFCRSLCYKCSIFKHDSAISYSNIVV